MHSVVCLPESFLFHLSLIFQYRFLQHLIHLLKIALSYQHSYPRHRTLYHRLQSNASAIFTFIRPQSNTQINSNTSCSIRPEQRLNSTESPSPLRSSSTTCVAKIMLEHPPLTSCGTRSHNHTYHSRAHRSERNLPPDCHDKVESRLLPHFHLASSPRIFRLVIQESVKFVIGDSTFCRR
mgnify:CR=1 FL=1